MIQETAHAAPGEWESFYIIVGSSAAALTGLQFVVITLIGEAQSRSSSTGGIGAFATPNWIWHISLPGVVYATQFVAGLLLTRYTLIALFATAIASLLLVYIGIHNAWDTSTYMVAERLKRDKEEQPAQQ